MNTTSYANIIRLAKLAFFALFLGPVITLQADTLALAKSAFVKSGFDADNNFGSESTLAVAARGTSYNRKAYLQIDLTNLTASQTWFSASSLELTAYTAPLIGPATGSVTFHVYGVVDADMAWNESTITWNNAPNNDIASAGGVNPAGTVLIDSFTIDTASITANQTFSISGELDNYLNWATGKLGDYYGTRETTAAGNLATLIITSTGGNNDPGVRFYSDDTSYPPSLSYTVGVPALSAPVLNKPTNDAAGYERFPAFTWSPTTGASRYEIQVSNSAGFFIVVDQDVVELTRYVPLEALWPSTRHWRVRALGDNGESSPWSAVFRYHLSEPTNQWTVTPTANWADTVKNLIDNATGPIKIVFEPGDYTYTPTTKNDVYPIRITGKEDVILDGQGAVVKIQPSTVSGGHVIPGFANISNSKRITLRRFTLDYDPVPQFVGIVESLSQFGNFTHVVLDKAAGYPDLDSDIMREHWDFASVLDQHWQSRVESVQGRLKPDADIVWSLDKNSVTSLGSGRYQVTVTHPAYNQVIEQLALGDPLVLFARKWHEDSPVGSITSTYRSDDVALEGLTVHAAPAGHFQFHESPGGKVLNCQLVPKAGRWLAGNADGVHCFGGAIGPWIENCEFEAIGDDGIALYNKGLFAMEVLSTTSIRIWPNNMHLANGDRFRIFHALRGEMATTVYTLTSEPLKYPTSGLAEYYDLTFSPPLVGTLETSYTTDETKHLNDQLFSISERNASFMIRDNRFAAIRRYGCAVKSAKGALVGNRFEGVSSSAVAMINEANYWANGPYCYDVLVANNILSDCGYDKTARYMAGIHLESWKPDPTNMWGHLISEYLPHGLVMIRDNVIDSWEHEAVLLGNAYTSQVTGNIIGPVRSPALLPGVTNQGIVLWNTHGAIVSGNNLLDSGLSTAMALEIPPSANTSATVENNQLP
ncbi:DUF7594 domain-containing protein [Rubellicoccus peritrichatus]|uniref:DNRLRE domain-containing protein n=1 Tax=Rubellicoccus peritrichatus TaxID=3080537 RepID=A0AAQ3QS71_9BACT|nr:DNRLRE domain-containing protein [Puniceicoccus sp. CR14]WOO40051.1 DNRLRE domain-containing protein [Puniceicoccus sp. CR14]